MVVIGIIAILATIVLIAINPARQFKQARDTQRTSNVNAILNAIGQRYADHKGQFRDSTETVCTSAAAIPVVTTVPSPLPTATPIGSKIANTAADLRPCLVPTYMSELTADPNNSPVTGTTYDTGYYVFQDSNGRITVYAPETELAVPVIQVTR